MNLQLSVALVSASLLASSTLSFANDGQSENAASVETGPENRAIIGGTPAAEGDWPDVAGVYYGQELGCTGTLIAPNVVLTAGHCIDESIGKVVLGSIDAANAVEEIAVSNRIAYPNWENSLDVAILILAQNSSIKPRMIATGCALESYYSDGAAVELVGYGATDVQGEVYGTRLMAGTATITDSQCASTASGCIGSVSPGGELIVGGGGVDSCFGDSGGPVYLRGDGADYLIGVTSRGVDNSPTPCGSGGIYARADAVVDWIESQAQITLPVANCASDGTDPGDESNPEQPGDETPGEPGDGTGGGNGDGTGNGNQGGNITGGCSSAGGQSAPLAFALFGLLLFWRRRISLA